MLKCDLSGKQLQAQRRELTALIEKLAVYISEDCDSDSGSSISEASESEKLLDSTIKELRTYIGCLVNLTLSLGHPALDPVDAETENIEVALFEVPEAAEPWCRRITDKYTNVDIRLAERLGEANWHRYQRTSRKIEEASDGELIDQDEGDEREQSIFLSKELAISTATKSANTSVLTFDNQSSQISTAIVKSTVPSTVEYSFKKKNSRWSQEITDHKPLKLH